MLPGIRYKADSGKFDGNRIANDLENNGMLVSHRITGHSGMEWPKGSHKYINFASGLWIAGKVGGDKAFIKKVKTKTVKEALTPKPVKLKSKKLKRTSSGFKPKTKLKNKQYVIIIK